MPYVKLVIIKYRAQMAWVQFDYLKHFQQD